MFVKLLVISLPKNERSFLNGGKIDRKGLKYIRESEIKIRAVFFFF